MNIRELVIQRILFSLSDEELESNFNITINELDELSDLDLFELFEEVYVTV